MANATPKDANEAFLRLTPRLIEISKAVDELPLRERMHFAHMLVGYFMSAASAHRRADLRLVQDTPQDLAS